MKLNWNMAVLIGLFSSLPFDVVAEGYSATELRVIQKEIFQHAKNINQLEKGLIETDEKETALTVHQVAMELNDKIGFLDDLGTLYGGMVNSNDRIKVRQMILTNKQFFNEECNEDVNYITTNLAYMKNPALISESEKLRDGLNSACEFIKNWK